MDAARTPRGHAGNSRALPDVSKMAVQRIQLNRVDTFSIGFAALVILATLNREVNAALIVGAWFAFFPHRLRLGLFYGLLAVLTYGAVRLAVGEVPNEYTLAFLWTWNTTPFRLFEAFIPLALLLPLVAAYVIHWQQTDRVVRRLIIILLPPYLLLFLGLGAWHETRLLMPVLILLFPLLRLR